MKTTRHIRTLAAACAAAIVFGGAVSASADMIINVDTAAQEYYLSGSATGEPFFDRNYGFYLISWDNDQDFSSDYENFLSPAAFTVSGNTITNSAFGFIHADGSVGGNIYFDTGNSTTLTGVPSQRYDYSGWSSSLRAELEDKAATGETLPVSNGSSSFAMTFAQAPAAVPEPGSLALLSTGMTAYSPCADAAGRPRRVGRAAPTQHDSTNPATAARPTNPSCGPE